MSKVLAYVLLGVVIVLLIVGGVSLYKVLKPATRVEKPQTQSVAQTAPVAPAPVVKQEASQVQAQPQIPQPETRMPVSRLDRVMLRDSKPFGIYDLTSSLSWESQPFALAERVDGNDVRYVYLTEKEKLRDTVVKFDDHLCWYKLRPDVRVFDGTVFQTIQSADFEIRCARDASGWQYAPNILVKGVVFPSELTSDTELEFWGEPPLYLGFKTNLEKLKADGKWIVKRGYGARFVVKSGAGNPIGESWAEIHPDEKLAESLFVYLEKEIPALLKFRDGVRDTGAARSSLFSVSGQLYEFVKWFDEKPEPEQMDLVSKYAPAAAKIAVKLVDQKVLSRFLLDLDWDRDIVTADPRWYDDWYKIQPDIQKRVPYFLNMAFVDLGFCLFWARRGETFFRIVKRAVSDEVIATAANTKQ